MDACKIALFGHRYISSHREVEEKLYPMLYDLINKKEFVSVYIGRNGEFDILAASVVKRVQKSLGNCNSELLLTLPYSDTNIEYYALYYDDIIIPDCLKGVHPKGAITRRNKWMVEQCDLFVCFVERNTGGAYTALKYAKKLGKKTLNLATADFEIE